MQRQVVLVGSGLALLGLVRVFGAERLAGIVGGLDRSSGLFTTWVRAYTGTSPQGSWPIFTNV